jgi:hypothetical protein
MCIMSRPLFPVIAPDLTTSMCYLLLGARIPMRRFTVSAEMGFMIHHAILSRKKASTETIFDFDMSGVYHRLWLTYRL